MPFGSEACLTRAHDRQFDRVGPLRQLRRFESADAMLGADAAAETLDQIEHGRLERLGAREEGRARRARPLAHVEVQVAVPHVSVAHHFAFGRQPAHQLRAALDQRRDARDREPKRRA